MSSIYSVVWSDESIKNLNSIIDYLVQNWSLKERSDFYKKLEKRIEMIKHYPEIFRQSPQSKSTHRSVLTKQITLYYSVENQVIRILSLFDVRQDPSKLKV